MKLILNSGNNAPNILAIDGLKHTHNTENYQFEFIEIYHKCSVGCSLEILIGVQVKILHTSTTIQFPYDTSFLKRIEVVINGDVESNPGPIASAQLHHIAIGRYYNKVVYLNNGLDGNIEMCFCHKYEQSIFKHSGYNFLTMIEMFDNNLVEKHNEYTAKDLEFCIATIELVCDISFLKLLQLIVDGDVELNPGPSNTPTGTQKGRKTKKTTFNFARKN